MESNEQAYNRYINGDESGLRDLMERHGNGLTFYINGYVGDLNEAEDLMIESFARMMAKRPHFEENGFKSYLYKTGRNLALRHAMKRRIHCQFGFEGLENEPDGKPLMDDIMKKKELNYVLHLSLQQLHPDYREVLYLIYFEEMTYEQAAKVMKKTVKQIANLAYRGKLAMRPILEKEGINHA